MNKIIIPSILVAVLLTAAFFAVMPVQQASTVHTTISGGVDKHRSVATWSLDDVAGATIADGEIVVLMDLHKQCATTDGCFMIVNIAADPADNSLEVVTLDATLTVLSSAGLADLDGAGALTIHHGHVPSTAGTILLGLRNPAGGTGAVAVAAEDYVTITINALV